MRLSSLGLAAVLLLSPTLILAQHSSGGSSSGGGSHASSSGGANSGGGSSNHSSGGGYSPSGGSHSSGSSHSSSSSHNSAGTHNAGGGHASDSSFMNRGSGSHSKSDRGSSLVSPTRTSSNSSITHPIHEPRPGIHGRATAPEKRGFFSVLFHPFRKPQPKPEPRPALYLPRPICPHGHCAPKCPVGQVRSGGACTTAVVPVCSQAQIWNGIDCGQSWRERCTLGEIWNGISCVRGSVFVDHCYSLRAALERQNKRVRAAASARQNACSFGVAQDCSEANIAWQNEENLRQDLMTRYRQCQMQSVASSPGLYDPADSTHWFDSLQFNF